MTRYYLNANTLLGLQPRGQRTTKTGINVPLAKREMPFFQKMAFLKVLK